MLITKVKVIERFTCNDFENELRNFVSEIDPDNLIDIKYEVSRFKQTEPRSYASNTFYSALVIYKG